MLGTAIIRLYCNTTTVTLLEQIILFFQVIRDQLIRPALYLTSHADLELLGQYWT
jgi:hypothetical protein